MKCPYCGSELIQVDSYGNHDYICHGDKSGYKGDIFKCPNFEGFEIENDKIEYQNKTGNNDEYIVCESACFNGNFYTDRNENLYEGYPC